MNAPDSDHETPVDGLVDVHGAPSDTVQPAPTAPNQQLQLVPHANVTEVRVSGIDGLGVLGDGVYSSSFDGQFVGMTESMVSSNPKASKKRSGYNRGNRKRFIWSDEPHQCFLDCYNRLPEDKRVPKRITEDMMAAGCILTRENVASHLQKHRLNLKGRETKKRNPGRPSSTSVPPKEAEKNLPKFHNGTSNSTYPNGDQIFQQTLFISTIPDFQSPSFSTNPNSQLPFQTSPISTNPNSQLPFQRSPISTNPNSQLPFQRSPISTNPNSQLPFQSSPISTNPNSQLPFQRSPISTNPNSQLPFQSSPISTNPISYIPQQSASFSNSLNSQSHYLPNNPNSHPIIIQQSPSLSATIRYSRLPFRGHSLSANSPISQSHSLSANSPISQSHSLSANSPISQSHSLSANSLSQSHSFSANSLSQSHSFSANSPISQSHSLSSNSPISQSHSLSSNSLSQSHSFSANSPTSQSHSFSSIPTSQSHSFSSIPNSYQPNETMLNHELFSHFEQIPPYDPNANYVGRYSDLSVHGEANISDFSFGGTGLYSSNTANNSDFHDMTYNHFPSPTATNYQLGSNIDGLGNVIHPTPAYSTFGDFSGNNYPLGARPNFNDYHMNMNLDHNVQVAGFNNMNMDLHFNYPLNSNVANEFQMNGTQEGLQPNLGPPAVNGVDNKPKLPQNFGSHHPGC